MPIPFLLPAESYRSPEKALNPVKQTSLGEAAGMGVMRGATGLAGAGVMAAGGVEQIAGGVADIFGFRPADHSPDDYFFQAYEDYIKPAKRYWTPDQRTVSASGKLFGAIAEMAPLFMFGEAAAPLMVAQSTMNTAVDLTDEGVDSLTAIGSGLMAGLSAVGMVKIPQAGKNWWQTAGLALANPAIGAAQTEIEKQILKGRGYDRLSEAYNPFDITARSVDVVMGAMFGAMGHMQRKAAGKAFNTEKNAALVTIEDLLASKDYWKAIEKMPIEAEDVLDVIRSHQKTLKAMQFDPSNPNQVRAHLAAMDIALGQLTKDQPVQISSKLRDVLSELPTVFTSKEMLEGFKKHFNLPSDDAAMGLVAYWDAHAKSKGMDLNTYLQKKVAGIVPGLELPQDALYQIVKGDFGPVYDQFKGKANEAVEYLKNVKDGEAIGALTHKDIAEGIDLVWGKEGTKAQDYEDGYGLAKILVKHTDVANDLQGMIDTLEVNKKKSSDSYLILESLDHKAVIRLDWNRQKKTWLLTGFKKEEPSQTGRSAGVSDLNGDMPPISPDDSSDSNIPPSEGDVKLQQRHKPTSTGEPVTKGAVQFLEDGRAIIHAFKSADLTTAIHETAHIWRRDLEGEDLAIIENWAQVKDGKWEVKHEELFAKGFERYVMEGNAPSPELKGIFEQFKVWMMDIYRRLIGEDWRGTIITKEVREVFDRMLTPAELEKIESREIAGKVVAEALPRIKEDLKEAGIPEEITVKEPWSRADSDQLSVISSQETAVSDQSSVFSLQSLADIPADLEVEITAVKARTGERVKVKENARKAWDDLHASLDKYEALRKCLQQ